MIKNNKGFSLIELLIAVLIIGILAQLAIPKFREASERAKYKQIDTNMNAMHKALRAFYAEHGGYPPDVYPGEAPPGLVPNFLDKWPTAEDDPFGSSYDYEAWSVGGDKYWIGVTYNGKNQVRDTGSFAGCYFVQLGATGVPIKEKDDVGIEIDPNGPIVEDVVDLTLYRRIGTGVYRAR